MKQPLWGQLPPPSTAVEAAVWDADLSAPVDVTRGRRRLHADLLRRPQPPGARQEDIERLLAIFEELASNGVRHGRAPVRAHVTTTGHGWLIDVTDTATDRPPTPAVHRDPARGGLGLYLVARLSTAHGWAAHRGRKHVWAWVRPRRA